jgi:hypothetical protein
LVAKPDQLIKRRGKLGLIAVNKTFAEVKEWVSARMGQDQQIGNTVGKLRNFIIEPFLPHKDVRLQKKERILFPQLNIFSLNFENLGRRSLCLHLFT